MDRTEILAALRAVPEQVEATCAAIAPELMVNRPPGDGWSLVEIICHLRDDAVEEGLRLKRMVEEDNPTLDTWDQEARAEEGNYRAEDPQKALTALRAFWSGYCYQLEQLDAAAWQRTARHPELGEVTIHSRAERRVAHARAHVAQLLKVRDAVSG